MRALTERDDNILNGTTAILGLILLLCPWLLGFATVRSASWTAGTGGLVIAIISAAALTQRAEWHEWINLAAGLCLVASPWLFGFTDVTTAAATHMVLGGCRDLAVPQHPTGQTCLSHGGCSAGVALRIRTLWRTRNARSSSRRTSTGIGI